MNVSGHLAIKDLDLSSHTNYGLASPFYANLVVDGDRQNYLWMSIMLLSSRATHSRNITCTCYRKVAALGMVEFLVFSVTEFEVSKKLHVIGGMVLLFCNLYG